MVVVVVVYFVVEKKRLRYIHALLCKSQSLPNVFRASEAFLF